MDFKVSGNFKPHSIYPLIRSVVDGYFSHSEVYFTVKDLWSPMGVLQRGQKVKLV